MAGSADTRVRVASYPSKEESVNHPIELTRDRNVITSTLWGPDAARPAIALNQAWVVVSLVLIVRVMTGCALHLITAPQEITDSRTGIDVSKDGPVVVTPAYLRIPNHAATLYRFCVRHRERGNIGADWSQRRPSVRFIGYTDRMIILKITSPTQGLVSLKWTLCILNNLKVTTKADIEPVRLGLRMARAAFIRGPEVISS